MDIETQQNHSTLALLLHDFYQAASDETASAAGDRLRTAFDQCQRDCKQMAADFKARTTAIVRRVQVPLCHILNRTPALSDDEIMAVGLTLSGCMWHHSHAAAVASMFLRDRGGMIAFGMDACVVLGAEHHAYVSFDGKRTLMARFPEEVKTPETDQPRNNNARVPVLDPINTGILDLMVGMEQIQERDRRLLRAANIRDLIDIESVTGFNTAEGDVEDLARKIISTRWNMEAITRLLNEQFGPSFGVVFMLANVQQAVNARAVDSMVQHSKKDAYSAMFRVGERCCSVALYPKFCNPPS